MTSKKEKDTFLEDTTRELEAMEAEFSTTSEDEKSESMSKKFARLDKSRKKKNQALTKPSLMDRWKKEPKGAKLEEKPHIEKKEKANCLYNFSLL